MDFRSARRSERDEVLDLLALWYNDREFSSANNQKDPTFRDDLCLVALDGGRIVSTVQIFDRWINVEGKAVPMGGIGSVFTREDYRHKRVASGLMNLAVTTMERAGFEVSLLFRRASHLLQPVWMDRIDAQTSSVLGEPCRASHARF